MELFFDLVYVFAVTQLSRYLYDHLTARGALETLVLFLAVWWAWNYTAWATNWIDPDTSPVRVLLLGLMLLSLIMSAAIPEAFGSRGLAFAGAYVAIQLVRSGFMVAAFGRERMGRNYAQLLAWSAIAAVFWLAGAAVHGDARLAVWIVALAVDYGAPMHGFWLPGAGRTPTRDWTLAGGHLAERCRLVLLIALGESILAVGVTFAALTWSRSVLTAFVVGFVGTVSLYWIYFGGRSARAGEVIERAEDPTRIGRTGYAYAHGIMVGGVIVVAVGIELTISHATGATSAAAAWAILAGPAVYLAGNSLFKITLSRTPPVSRLVAIAVLALLAPLALVVDPLALSAAAAAVTVTLAIVLGRSRAGEVAAVEGP